MAQLLTAMSTLQLFRALVLAGGELFSTILISSRQLQAFDVQVGDLAVTALSDHLGTGGAITTVTGESTGVGASRGAGLRATLFTLLTFFSSLCFLSFGVRSYRVTH